MNDNADVDELISFVNGSLPKEKKGALLKKISSSEKTKQLFFDLKHIYSITHRRYGQIDADKEFRLIRKKMEKRSLKTIFFPLMKYAALLVLGLVIAWYALDNYHEDNELSYSFKSPSGQFSECVLADGTVVQLNSGSELRYSSSFSRKRRVYIKGEAFLSVAEDKANPFIVETSGGVKVRVLGTKFNVSAYPEDKMVETTLIEGKVEILNENNDVLTTLKPSQTAIYTVANNKLTVKQSNVQFYTSWQDGKISFENEPLLNIVKKMERWYNVEIEIEDADLEQIPFTLTVLRNKSVEQILKAIRFTYPIDYTIQEKNDHKNVIKLKKEKTMK